MFLHKPFKLKSGSKNGSINFFRSYMVLCHFVSYFTPINMGFELKKFNKQNNHNAIFFLLMRSRKQLIEY